MASTPTDICNLALDSCGIPFQLGEIEQGGREADVCLRAYGEALRMLLRAAPWAFARKQTTLQLLADASGSTPNVSTLVPGGYASRYGLVYAYPVDCARIRYIPANRNANPSTPTGNITPPNNNLPLLPSTNQNFLYGQRIVPTPFIVTNDPNFTAPPSSNAQFMQGQSPIGNTVILSNVQQATIVYTFNAIYPSLWDHLFRGAMVAYLAQQIAFPLWSSRNKPDLGVKVRAEQIVIAKQMVTEARAADGNEMTGQSSHGAPDWVQFRRTGGSGLAGYGSASGADYGCWGSGWNGSLSFANAQSY